MIREDAAAELERMVACYDPNIAALGRNLISRMRARLPQANLLVYDNYNALAVGFAPGDRASGVILSLALYPRWVSLFFMKGIQLHDPAHLLRGDGKGIRHVRLNAIAEFDRPEVEALIGQSLAMADPPLDPGGEGRLIIKSISPNQRPRRPAEGKA